MKTTLHTRLILLMVLSSIFLISAFTIIQLRNQLQRASELNVFRSKQSAFAVKDELERIFSDLGQGQPQSQAAKLSEVKKSFRSLLTSGAVETVVLLDRGGSTVILEGNLKIVFEDDKAFLSKIQEARNESRWFIPLIDEHHGVINLFVLFSNPYGYIAKVSFSTDNLQQALNQVYWPIFLTIIIIILANIVLAGMLSKALIAPVKILNQATKGIAGGDLDMKVSIDTQDELQELADTFNYMTVELKKMKERAENANPLTKLPGNIVIQEEVEKRFRNGEHFVLLYADLDNFKAFNDKYGVYAGDKAIALTAEAMKGAIASEGSSGDFVGHEGGDDFLLLTVPERAEKIARFITEKFDNNIRALYLREDIEKGYIEAKSRESEEIKRFPIMTISLAGVSNTGRDITSYAELTNIAAGIKKATKGIKSDKSKFMLDRRVIDLGAEFRGKGNAVSS